VYDSGGGLLGKAVPLNAPAPTASARE
jgi:hypothetical protein